MQKSIVQLTIAATVSTKTAQTHRLNELFMVSDWSSVPAGTQLAFPNPVQGVTYAVYQAVIVQIRKRRCLTTAKKKKCNTESLVIACARQFARRNSVTVLRLDQVSPVIWKYVIVTEQTDLFLIWSIGRL